MSGSGYEAARKRETDSDFLIFDVILLLTSVLAAVGVASQLCSRFTRAVENSRCCECLA